MTNAYTSICIHDMEITNLSITKKNYNIKDEKPCLGSKLKQKKTARCTAAQWSTILPLH